MPSRKFLRIKGCDCVSEARKLIAQMTGPSARGGAETSAEPGLPTLSPVKFRGGRDCLSGFIYNQTCCRLGKLLRCTERKFLPGCSQPQPPNRSLSSSLVRRLSNCLSRTNFHFHIAKRVSGPIPQNLFRVINYGPILLAFSLSECAR